MCLLARVADNEKFRFLAAGASTTVFSYLLYLPLLSWIDPMPAYATAYVAGVVWAYSINSVWVYRRSWTLMGLISYPLVYVIQAIGSFAIFAVLVGKLGFSATLAPLVAIVIMLPINYVLGKRIVYNTSRSKNVGDDRRS